MNIAKARTVYYFHLELTINICNCLANFNSLSKGIIAYRKKPFESMLKYPFISLEKTVTTLSTDRR